MILLFLTNEPLGNDDHWSFGMNTFALSRYNSASDRSFVPAGKCSGALAGWINPTVDEDVSEELIYPTRKEN